MKKHYTRIATGSQYYRVIQWLTGFFICIVPFVYWSSAYIPYEIPRVWFVLAGVDCLFLLHMYGYLRGYFEAISIGRIVPVIIFLMVCIGASLTGVDIGKSLWGNYYRLDGLVTLIHCMVFSVIVLWQTSARLTTKYPLFFATGSVGVSLWAVWERLRISMGQSQGTIWGGTIGVSFGNPVLLAGYLAVTLPFLLYLLRTNRSLLLRIFMTAGIIVQMLALVGTGSEGGMLTAILIFLTEGIRFIRVKKLKFIIAGFIFIGVVIISIISWKQASLQPFSSAPESRGRIFTHAILSFLKRPVLGFGWANFDHAFSSVSYPYQFSHDRTIDKAHSGFLEILTTTGIIGFTVYVFFLGYIVLNLMKAVRKDHDWSILLLTLFFAYLFHAQTNVISIAEELVFWFVVGIVLAFPGINPKFH